ncbi:Rv3235 family protein [Streptomyces sp. NPDC055506]
MNKVMTRAQHRPPSRPPARRDPRRPGSTASRTPGSTASRTQVTTASRTPGGAAPPRTPAGGPARTTAAGDRPPTGGRAETARTRPADTRPPTPSGSRTATRQTQPGAPTATRPTTRTPTATRQTPSTPTATRQTPSAPTATQQTPSTPTAPTPRVPAQGPRRPVPQPLLPTDRFADLLLAVLSGRRPVHSMLRHTRGRAYDELAWLAERGPLRTRGARPVVRDIGWYEPRPGAIEAFARIGAGDRLRAMAFRLELGQDLRWRCTAVELGGPRPPRAEAC